MYSFHVILVILGPEAQEFGSYSHQDSDDLGGLILPYGSLSAAEEVLNQQNQQQREAFILRC